MKKFLFCVLLLAGASTVKAGDVFSVFPESAYANSQSSMTFSSSTVVTFTAVSGYRQIKLVAPTSWFYTVDGSTLSMATRGFPVAANVAETIEYNGAISVISPISVSSSTGYYVQKRK